MVGTEDFLNSDGSGLNPIAVQIKLLSFDEFLNRSTGIPKKTKQTSNFGGFRFFVLTSNFCQASFLLCSSFWFRIARPFGTGKLRCN